MKKILGDKCVYVTRDLTIAEAIMDLMMRKLGKKYGHDIPLTTYPYIVDVGPYLSGNNKPYSHKVMSLEELEALPDFEDTPVVYEMTVSEISKALGKPVVVVEG